MTFRDSKGLDYKDVLLVPQHSDIPSRSDVYIGSWLTPNIDLAVPVVSANMDTITNVDVAWAMALEGSAGILHRYASPLEVHGWVGKLKALKKSSHLHGDLYVIPSIGVGDDQVEIAKQYLDLGADAINIDIAHGDSKAMVDTIRKLVNSQHDYVDLIVGNIATPEAARRLIGEGAMTVKVGIGPGAVCDTRKKTGAGYPQLSAIMEIAPIVHELDGCLIADGGIREVGDCVKALAAGADTVMSGFLFKGSAESHCRTYRGMASNEAQRDFKGFAKNIEGHSEVIESGGTILEIMKGIREGIQSGFSYCGSRTITELHENAEFVIIRS